MPYKPGTKLRSAADTTEVVLIRAPADDIDLRCGGHPMTTGDQGSGKGGDRPSEPAPLDPDFAAGTQLGKRYVDEAGTLELLCTKAGPGTLSAGSEPLTIKSAKPLPASD